jgi:hypothetical protein
MQCRSHPSPAKFPANREFYREFRKFRAYDGYRTSKKCLSRSHFSYNSLNKRAGKKFARTGNFFRLTGNEVTPLKGGTSKHGAVLIGAGFQRQKQGARGFQAAN